MKKFIFCSLLISGLVTAQTGRVGINTESPKTTLDVEGKKDGSGVSLPTDITGLQAPRLTRAELTAKGDLLYGTNQKGAIVYITDISGGDAAAPQRTKIDRIGYYYFDGTQWQIMAPTDIEPWYNVANNQPATANTQNIYQMGNVGVNLTNPTSRFHVYNSSNAIAPFTVESDNGAGNGLGNDAYFWGYGDARTPGVFFLSTRGSKTSPLDLQNGDLMGEFNFGGRVGGGMQYALTSARGVYTGDGNSLSAAFTIITSNNEKMRVDAEGDVGIGTTDPKAKLQVNGGDVYVETPGAGVILKSPNGSCFRLTATDSGNINGDLITCP